MNSNNRKTRTASPTARLQQINRSLKCSLRLLNDGLWISHDGRLLHLAVPEDIRQDVHAALAGGGMTPAAMARRLNSYGLSEFERRFVNAFPESEPDADRLTEASDHPWKVL